MFTVLNLDDFVPKDHPLHPIRTWLNDALKRMDDVFARMYEADIEEGRPSIAPEKLVRALLLQVLYSIRSERMLVVNGGLNLPLNGGRCFPGTIFDHRAGEKSRSGVKGKRSLAQRILDAAKGRYAGTGSDPGRPHKSAFSPQFNGGFPPPTTLVEQLSYNMLFRWFVGLSMDGTVWDHSTFSKYRDRLLEHDVLVFLFNETVETARERGYLSGEHFSVDGTLIQAWAGHKSFVPKASPDDDDTPPDEPPAPNDNWHGRKRSNETHQSTTDEQARLFRKSKGTGAMLCYMGHVLTDNRHGLVDNAQVTLATGTAERDAAEMMHRRCRECCAARHHGRSGQELRHCRLRRQLSRASRHATCGA
jgi:transposase